MNKTLGNSSPSAKACLRTAKRHGLPLQPLIACLRFIERHLGLPRHTGNHLAKSPGGEDRFRLDSWESLAGRNRPNTERKFPSGTDAVDSPRLHQAGGTKLIHGRFMIRSIVSSKNRTDLLPATVRTLLTQGSGEGAKCPLLKIPYKLASALSSEAVYG